MQPETEVVVQSSRSLSDDEEPGPGGDYRLERSVDDAADSFDEEEQIRDLVESDDKNSDHSESPIDEAILKAPKPPSSDAIYSKFINLVGEFITHLEDSRNQELMSRKPIANPLISKTCYYRPVIHGNLLSRSNLMN